MYMGKFYWWDNYLRVEIKVLREREVNGIFLKKVRIYICVFVIGIEDCEVIVMVEKVDVIGVNLLNLYKCISML